MFYRQFLPQITAAKKSGHPRWYGDKFELKDETTWHEPDEVIQSTFTTKKGRQLMVTISSWKQMLMRGTFNYKMNRHPFILKDTKKPHVLVIKLSKKRKKLTKKS